MEQRIALLSNTNMNFVIRLLQKERTVYEAEGYGNELGLLMNPSSSYHGFGATYTFMLMDVMEVIEHDLDMEGAGEKIEKWFGMLEAALRPEGVYYISDAYLWGAELGVVRDAGRKHAIEHCWQNHLMRLCTRHSNLRIFPYRQLIEHLGEDHAFSMKMWYMGRILLSNDAQKELCNEILQCLRREESVAKKVLLLDLDNTLWGGLAGEAEHSPIALSEEHSGLVYKNLQRVLLQMQKQGVLLAIVSKNNSEDALEIIKSHPHMVLREHCFVAKRINWQQKHENILEIARELNLGTDSFVFWDDNPTERELVKEMLPEVAVPDFPEKPEELASAMTAIYEEYFAKAVLTREDREKTKQYAANAKRNHLQESAVSFEDYLEQLQIVITRVNPAQYVERLVQMANKTNQFNLTTRRYDLQEMQKVLRDSGRQVYLYNVSDKFGDNGLVAMAIIHFSADVPVVEELVMSCRVMGKQIENAILADIERDLLAAGYDKLKGVYLPTAKNKPVAKLYENLDYVLVKELPDGGGEYIAKLKSIPERNYRAEIICEYQTKFERRQRRSVR